MIKYIYYLRKNLIYLIRRITKPKVVKNYGIKINLDKNISPFIRNYIYSGRYEKKELYILKNVINNNDKILEVGTGLGFLSIYCSKILGSNKVLTYEANRELFNIIRQNFKLNNVNPKLVNAILSDKKSSDYIFINEENFWSSSVIKRNSKAKKIKVPTENINNVITDNIINFLIIDIEGGEKDLIYKINFSKIKKILIEIHPHVIGDNECSKIISYLIKKEFIIDIVMAGDNVLYFYKV